MSSYKSKPQTELHYSPNSFMDALDEKIPDFDVNKNPDEYSFLSLKDIAAKDFPKESYIVDRLIPATAITCIGGLPATMKSYFTNYIATCIINKKPVLERFKTQKTNILFIDKENKLSRIKERFSRLGTTASENIHYLESNVLIDHERDLGAICSFIRDHNVQLTFIDTLVRVHQSEENSASEMNKVFLALKEMQTAGSAVCFLHHFNKRGSFGAETDVRDQLRGSGDILAMVDSFIALTRKENFIEVEQAKSRDEVVVPKFLMQADFNNNEAHFDYIQEVVDDDRIGAIMLGDQILALLQTGSMMRQHIEQTLTERGHSSASIIRAFAQLIKEGKIIKRLEGRHVIYSLNRQESIL